MKKLILIFGLMAAVMSCTNGSTVADTNDSTAVDTVVVDTVVADTID